MRLTFSNPDLNKSGALAVFATEKATLSPSAEKLDRETGGAIKRAISASKFKGNKGQTLTLLAPQGVKASQILLVGLGNANAIDDLAAQSAGGIVVRELSKSVDATASIVVDTIKGAKLSSSDFAANAAFGGLLRSYRFDKYLTKQKAEDKSALSTVNIMTSDSAKARKVFGPMSKVADGVFFTRDLVSEPANIIYPISFTARARSLAKLGVKLQILDQKQMEKLGMGALLGVAQGSAHAPRMVAMRWDGAPKAKNKAPIAFVGKGVTFDTGGI